MINEEMTLMALKYVSRKNSYGYTYFKHQNRMVAIYDKDGKPVPNKDWTEIQLAEIRALQKRHQEKMREESSKNT